MEGGTHRSDPQDVVGETVMRVFELRTDTEFAAFFADTTSDLPEDDVSLELRAVANAVTTRGALEMAFSDVLAAIVGGGVSAHLATYFPATATWLGRRSSIPKLDDVTAVLDRVRAVSQQIVGSAPESLREAAIARDADGQWHVAFSYRDLRITATIEPAGSVVTWRQKPLPRLSGYPATAGEPGLTSAAADSRVEQAAEGYAFLSAATEDAADADWLQEKLQGAGIQVWRDATDLLPGDNQPATIRRAI